MLIRITDHCKMGCSHCFIDSTPKGKHMDFPTFIKSVKFAIKSGVRSIIISGGEPTDHPQYVDFMNYLTLNYSQSISVCTHGMFIEDDNGVDTFIKPFKNVYFQIVNDPIFYPKSPSKLRLKEVLESNNNVSFFDHISSSIYPQGRARDVLKVTHETTNCKGSRCFNIRSIINSGTVDGFREAISTLEGANKFCTPSINIDGSIAMGESNNCPKTSKVTEELSEVFSSFKDSQCNDCGMLTNLDDRYKNAINYLG